MPGAGLGTRLRCSFAAEAAAGRGALRVAAKRWSGRTAQPLCKALLLVAFSAPVSLLLFGARAAGPGKGQQRKLLLVSLPLKL